MAPIGNSKTNSNLSRLQVTLPHCVEIKIK